MCLLIFCFRSMRGMAILTRYGMNPGIFEVRVKLLQVKGQDIFLNNGIIGNRPVFQ